MDEIVQNESRFRPLRTVVIGLTLFFGFVPWVFAIGGYFLRSNKPWIVSPIGTAWDGVVCHYAAWLCLHSLEALAQMERPGGGAAATAEQVKLLLMLVRSSGCHTNKLEPTPTLTVTMIFRGSRSSLFLFSFGSSSSRSPHRQNKTTL